MSDYATPTRTGPFVDDPEGTVLDTAYRRRLDAVRATEADGSLSTPVSRALDRVSLFERTTGRIKAGSLAVSALDTARGLGLDVAALDAIAAERAELERADIANRERIAAVVGPYHDALDDWRRASEAAVARGEEPPPEPECPNLNPALEGWTSTHARRVSELRNREARAWAELRPAIVAATERAEADTLERVRKALARHVAPAVDSLRAYRSLLNLAGVRDGPVVDTMNVVAAAEGEHRVLAFATISPLPPAGRVMVDNDPVNPAEMAELRTALAARGSQRGRTI